MRINALRYGEWCTDVETVPVADEYECGERVKPMPIGHLAIIRRRIRVMTECPFHSRTNTADYQASSKGIGSAEAFRDDSYLTRVKAKSTKPTRGAL